MKDELIKLLRRAEKDKPYPDELTEQIMYLIAPELEKARILNDKIGHLVATDIAVLVEKARKWDRVKEIAARDNSEECDKTCPYYDPDIVDQCKIFGGCPFCQVFDALTEKEPT